MKSFSKEKAQGLLEYALILMLVVLVVMVLLWLLGPAVGNMYSTVMNSI